MKTGLNITELAQRIEANRELKQDYIAPTEKISVELDDDGTFLLDGIAPEARFPILETAHDQIASRLNIPARYYDRMRSDAPDLLAANVNSWFVLRPEQRMIRTLGGDARAFLSNRYNRIENEEIAEVALPILADIPDVKIVSAEITERRMYIQAVTPRVQGEVKRGDVVQAGVVISNSEIGYGAVRVAAMDYRLVCLNGMISADQLRVNHVGRRIEDNSELWADDTLQADDRAVLLKVRDMVRAAVDETRFRERLGRMSELAEGRITGHPERAVEVLAKKVGANETETGGILRSLIQGGDLSAWGMLNAVTAQAHDAVSYDRSVEFEVAGGKLMNLSKKEWSEVLEAA